MSSVYGGTLGPDLLIAEMNHRWYNGLQGIIAALEECSRDEKPKRRVQLRLYGIAEQVHAMAALHRRLSRSPPPDQSFEQYCRALCMDVALSFGRFDIVPRVAMCDPLLSARTSHHLALLVVELMTNALKHGKPPAEGGVVWVRLEPHGLTHLELTVEDNFAPPDPAAAAPRLIEALTEQLHGSLHIDLASAYRAQVRIPIL
jgi:two-component sensor histidine kinase